jgi:XTP/dITP diphosphohydrolase
MKTVLASSNRGKLAELNTLLSAQGFELVSQDDLGIAPGPEDGLTFIENALAKARHASQASGLAAIADDSGIVVDALGGAPGIHSARYAGPGADDAANNNKLINALQNKSDRHAHYYCVIVYLRSALDPVPVIATGRWAGLIIDEARGDGGFGYDPYFYLPDLTATAAQLDPEQKNALSHRGQAVRGFLQQLQLLRGS